MGRENKLQSLFSFCSLLAKVKTSMAQGGKSWQPFGKVKNGHKIFRQARICYFCDKKASDMEFVQNFTPPDFQAKNFTMSISPNFNSFSGKKTEK